MADLSGYDGICLSGISLAIFTRVCRRRVPNDLDALATAGVSIYLDCFYCNYRLHLWKSAAEAIEGFRHMNRISDYVFQTTQKVKVMVEKVAA